MNGGGRMAGGDGGSHKENSQYSQQTIYQDKGLRRLKSPTSGNSPFPAGSERALV